ncbi:MAG: HAMP domain-containing protein, partial [Syntrophaceae bacterium]|nr:HAMP domain-containing protein [Syntrophaceae bacterium]
MRLTIFSRLIYGYLVVFLLIFAVSVYMIYQLAQFETITHSILEVDHRMEDGGKKLTDSLLSQMRFEKKFMVVRDEALYEQFLLARDDFQKYLEEVMRFADTPLQKELLGTVKVRHQAYQALVAEEAAQVRANQPYPLSGFVLEKEKMADRLLEHLQTLAVHSQQNTLGKIKKLEEARIHARQLTMGITGIALLAVVVLSFFITVSITHPISLLIGKTRDIARGTFDGHLPRSAPPEIKELGVAFGSMFEQLKTLDQMKSDFFSTISHELRTPLTSIKEGTSLLLEGVGGEITEKQRKLLKIISGESNRLIELVNASLDLSKMEAGKMAFHFARADIRPLIQKVTGEIEPLAMAKKVRLQVENHEALPPVKMDREKILQVLRNLLGNAVKFSFEGGEVRISAHRENGKMRVAVSDTGPGIPREDLATIFEKFRQGPRESSATGKGTGLG